MVFHSLPYRALAVFSYSTLIAKLTKIPWQGSGLTIESGRVEASPEREAREGYLGVASRIGSLNGG